MQTQDEGATRAAREPRRAERRRPAGPVRELAALSPTSTRRRTRRRDKLSATVTGPEVNDAEKYLTRLTDRPELSEAERGVSPQKLEAALSARVDRMRSVESALTTGQVRDLEGLRDDDVTALELCHRPARRLLPARRRRLHRRRPHSLTQPLAVLRIGAARLAEDPENAEPVRYTGRNDEFAQVVRSMNALHGRLTALHQDLGGRVEGLTAERSGLIKSRESWPSSGANSRSGPPS